jgi:hypothetical protein
MWLFTVSFPVPNDGAKPPGVALLGPVREEVVGVTGGAQTGHHHLAHSGRHQLPAIGFPQVEVSAVVRAAVKE